MLVFSHMKIGNYVYKGLKASEELNQLPFKISYWHFIYGNIKPDISEMASLKHHLSETYSLFLDNKKKVLDDQLSDKKKSEALGVTMHFMCDYFTKFHAIKAFNERNIYDHFMYELKLHSYLVVKLFIKKIMNNRTIKNLNIFKVFEDNYSLISILSSYYCSEESVKTDLAYALFAINDLMVQLLGIQPFELDKEDVKIQNEVGVLRRVV